MYAHLRTAVVAGAAALSLGLAPGQPAAADVLGERQLREALLDAVDLPAGWAGDSERSAAERGFGVPRPAEPACGGLFDSTADTAARAGFARTRSGPFVTTVAAAHGDEAAAGRVLAAVEGAVRGACATVHTQERAGEGTVTVSYDAAALDAERLGDESVAVRYQRRPSGPGAATPVVADLVVVRVGAHTVRVAQAGREDEGTEEMAAIAERAAEKLRQVAEGRTPAPPPDQPGTTDL
ncbi:hypothetical protein [Streptomyces johnsoniae]|uniref:PknH-like extracellular domain-containing protein n=1 Tax=Streptomyces johnsoniae TaxID=3075532 RepID=A0ABU2S5K1_9ACTN|nr:hypothetical protein [Streptomyces sp. DSM 41886]MDT0443971.1 hypothetical protein [Streptomyces sp. DSM 41886]